MTWSGRSLSITEGPGVVARIPRRLSHRRGFLRLVGWPRLKTALPASADADQALVRGALGPAGGHATLIDAPSRACRVAVFQPPALAALSARVKKLRSQTPL